jgi:hypothetical protein
MRSSHAGLSSTHVVDQRNAYKLRQFPSRQQLPFGQWSFLGFTPSQVQCGCNPMDASKRKRGIDRPTLDEFHEIVKQLAPGQKFTKAAVESFRTAYFRYLSLVASSLVLHDKVVESDGIVSDACMLDKNPVVVGWEKVAQNLLQAKKGITSTANSRSKAKRPKQITAEMEVEQERLLKKSMDALKDRQELK